MRSLLFLARQEFKRSWRVLLLAFVILFLGFIGPLLTVTLRSSTDEYLQARSRDLLQADLALTSLRELTTEEHKAAALILKPVQSSSEIKFVSMIQTVSGGKEPSAAALVEVHGVDEAYPLYGKNIIVDLQGQRREAHAIELQSEPSAWVDSEVLEQLHLSQGGFLKLGHLKIKITGELQADGAFSRAGFAFAPLVYISKGLIAKTGLTSFGSQVQYRESYRLKGHPNLAQLSVQVKNALPSPDVFLRTPDDSVQGIERFLDFFSKYISAITVSVFVLSWVASFYVLQVFVQDRLKNGAILLVLGASQSFVALLALWQILLLLLSALFLAVLTTTGLLALAGPFLKNILPEDLVFHLSGTDILKMTVIAVLSAFIFTLPLFIRLRRIKLNTLLDEGAMSVASFNWLESVMAYLPLFLVFMGLVSWLMNSLRFGAFFLAGLLLTGLLSWVIGRLIFSGTYRLLRHRAGRLRLIFMNLSRKRFGTDLCFFALLQLALILNIVPHLLNSVLVEMQPLQNGKSPSFFIFNLQDNRVQPLKEMVAGYHAHLDYLSPMLLARLTGQNGHAIESEQLLRYPVRLSYREDLIPSEKIIAGQDFKPKIYSEASKLLPQLSLEKKFAERQGFKIGDTLEFDLQGVPIKGQVVNLRRVRWTDFHPNFFIEFQPGVIDDAPKTWVASIHLDDHLQKAKLQHELIVNFSDVSLIDIDQSLQRVRQIADSMIGPIQAVAWIAVMFSLFILSGVIFHNLRLRRQEFDIEKMLGANLRLLRSLKTAEYFFLSFLAALAGLGFGLLTSHLITTRLLDIESRFDYRSAIFSALVLTMLTSGLTFLVANLILKKRTSLQKL